jgi:L-ascorbate metabolism protein UlaG (beta-lactamase superfamily)
MPRILKTISRAIYLAIMLLLAALIVVPHFLDRIYYQGPQTDHYDGARFFNTDGGDLPTTGPNRYFTPTRILRFFLTDGRPVWPDDVPITPSRPTARVEGEAMRVTWIGHATALVQTEGLNILTDPIWSDRASPVSGIGPKRHRQPGVRFEDLPKIDLVLLSHSHYDHMDIPTLRRLWERDKPLILTSLGNDTILKGKGIDAVARDWGQSVSIRAGITVFVDRVHHWGTRFAKDRNRMLWSGFTVTLPGGNLYFAGDTGFGDGIWPYEAAHHGPIRFALIPIGSYKPREMMAANHLNPAEAVTVFERLGAMYALGIHWGTFQLAADRIDDPPADLRAALATAHIAADRFRAPEAGEAWDVPSLGTQRPRPNRPVLIRNNSESASTSVVKRIDSTL